jgi:hypothetical protein
VRWESSVARSKSELSLTAAFPSPSFFPTALNFPQTMDRHGGKESRHQTEGRLFTHYRRGLKEVRSDYNNGPPSRAALRRRHRGCGMRSTFIRAFEN